MTKKHSIISYAILFSLILLVGCVEEVKSPKASFTISSNDRNFSFNSTSFDEDGKIVNFTWFIDDDIISYEKNVSYTFSDYGTYQIKLIVIDNQALQDSYEKQIEVINNSILSTNFYGLWQWSDENQTGNWSFYRNNSLKSEFRGKYGANVKDWWKWKINGTDEICFTQPSDEKLVSACYKFEFLDNHTILRVTYQGNTADWYKISDNP